MVPTSLDFAMRGGGSTWGIISTRREGIRFEPTLGSTLSDSTANYTPPIIGSENCTNVKRGIHKNKIMTKKEIRR